MKYNNYSEDDFIKDEYFQKWVLDTDAMATNFWENWLKDHPEKKDIVENAKRFILLMSFDDKKLSSDNFDAMWRNIVECRDDEIGKYKRKKSFGWTKNFPVLRVAAVFTGLVILGSGIYLFNPFVTNNAFVGSDSQVILELQDGTKKVLDESSVGELKNQKGQTVLTKNQNTLIYKQAKLSSETLEYNQLTVPYGKKFQLVLSDGSHVFLNSGSVLRYPFNFLEGKPRDVYLDGEAYFAVQKDKNPFTVITDDMNTQVYGTEFNVSSYKNENNTSTVLVEGSVGVYRSSNEQDIGPIIIKPGERAVFKENTIAVENTEVSKYIAWKDNKLFFVNDRFELIIKELERHFNVQIENKYAELNSKRFTGTFEKESLETILKTCQAHTPFDYEVDGGKITITN